MSRLLAALAVVALAFAQEKPKQRERDLKYEVDNPSSSRATEAVPSIPRGYALIIGVATYPNLGEKAQLLFPERDADAIYSILISPEGGNFRAENVKRLVGAKATLANIKRELETWLPAVATENDRVIIYFAGHGFIHPKEGKGYLAPYDFNPKDISGTGYPMDALGKVIGSRIKAKWKVLLTDACHSGAITPEDDRQKINATLLDLSSSLFSMTASRDREQSLESPEWGGGHGIFTYYVVKGFEGEADETGDGIVTADELSEYVRVNVRSATSGRQNPTSDRGSFDKDMLLAFVPSHRKPGEPAPVKFGTLVIEANMDGVEVFVDGISRGVVNQGTPLKLPGMTPGVHTVKGVRMGYEPDGPREEMVYPGRDATVSVKIMVPRRRPKAAVDFFDNGMEFYNKGFEGNYRKAVAEFGKALAADPNYSQAALYLGRTYDALFELDRAEQYYRRAIEIDPDYLEARASFGGMLLGKGSVDEAIRQFEVVTQRDPRNTQAWYLLAQAQRMKGIYADSIESARRAIKLNPGVPEAHFWLAESLRMSGKYQEAVHPYLEYLRLSDFDNKLAGKMHYYVLGYLAGIGRKKRAAQTDIWKDLRSMAYFGLCDAERWVKRYDSAISYCQKALMYDRADAQAYFVLGVSYAQRALETDSLELMAAARKSFASAVSINPDLDEAKLAQENIRRIDEALRQQ